ncbi:MAG: DUF4395 domain-containing protein [Nanoarchaeota archaeon]|nr:DUF4395 domain-containing protein [Nanoarchaeota archaeon]
MKEHINFGERHPDYEVKVLNEREARAGAGILFLFAMISFFNAFLSRNYVFLKVFITAFMVDFLIRIFINPKFSPVLILGRIMVKGQKPEYTGAPQKKFAWALGLVMSVVMFLIVVVSKTTGPINFAICLICLTLLFFETAFGTCIGCSIYNMFSKKKAKLCPGGACELRKKEKIQEISSIQVIILIAFTTAVISALYFGFLL